MALFLPSIKSKQGNTQNRTGDMTMSVFFKDLLLGLALVCLMLAFTVVVQAADVVPGTRPQLMAASATWQTLTTAVYPQLQP